MKQLGLFVKATTLGGLVVLLPVVLVFVLLSKAVVAARPLCCQCRRFPHRTTSRGSRFSTFWGRPPDRSDLIYSRINHAFASRQTIPTSNRTSYLDACSRLCCNQEY